ncbi:GNAT family N-acetyltransferase [Glaciimonas soli]|uniref:GNAT family N-acetyltransferase n=1 Tax=Glaciimonas soli TaxID=2590999 RepID=A0A843YV53_9BURK|nr:GNAT family N-acetyltransferase [Glaciimonas soli]MQR00496.1 GNAT family N-acetyltransferase [Glaciimonas soli]
MIIVAAEDPTSSDAYMLMAELSATLAMITGDSGNSSFDPSDVRVPNALFVVARDSQGRAIGCGAFRPLTDGVAELKRMYSRPGNPGTGSALLAFLEAAAKAMQYQALWLETRLINKQAVRFYEQRAYKIIPNFGKYAGNNNAVCFEKRLT